MYIRNKFIELWYKWLGSFAWKYPGIKLYIHDDKAVEVIKRYGKFSFCSATKNIESGYFVIDVKQLLDDICIFPFSFD